MIVGGARDKAVLERQLADAAHRSAKPLGKAFFLATRSRCASYVSQFETLPVVRNGKRVSHIRGAYLAALIRRSSCWAILLNMGRYFRNYAWLGEKTRAPSISFGVIQYLESKDAE